jgi:hypothetical protein
MGGIQYHKRFRGSFVLWLGLALLGMALGSAPAQAGAMIVPPFTASYTLTDLGSVPGVPPLYGGLTTKFDDPNTLIIGGNANVSTGALYSIGLVRDAQGHITGFSGTASFFAAAAFNDGGVRYGPSDVLFLARWPVNELGQTAPGSSLTDRIINMTPFGVGGISLSALNFVPAGYPGAGSMKLVSWPNGNWYQATIAPDGTGLFNVVSVTAIPTSNLPGGPEGFDYVPLGSALFPNPSMLQSEFSAGAVSAYDLNANGDPIPGTRRTFITGLTGAEGAFVDPVTGDFLFSTFGGGNRVIRVSGFAPRGGEIPEPSTLALFGLGILGLVGWGWRRRRVTTAARS